LDFGSKKEGGGDPFEGGSSSSSESEKRSGDKKNKKRKRKNEKEENPQKKRKEVKMEESEVSRGGNWIPLGDVIQKAKKKLQSSEKKNGVTFAFIGSSGCGKSTLIRKVFIDDLFTKRAKEEDGKEFIIQVFTESSKSDAFDGLAKDKNILMDCKGLDEDNINWCYHTNENYDKKYNFMIILDDVLEIQYKKLVRRMFLIMRNTNISSLVSLQYPNLIPKSVRTSVYFTVLFFLNTDEGIELAVRGWLSAYLPGKAIKEKVLAYRSWTQGEDGHQMFLLDNLNHKCYYVTNDYFCKEMPMIRKYSDEQEHTGSSTKAARKYNQSTFDEQIQQEESGGKEEESD
jgi:hypothetical protein